MNFVDHGIATGSENVDSSSSLSREFCAFSSTGMQGANLNYGFVPKEDFGEFKEYSVIFTNRSLNLMSSPFQRVMRDLNDLLKEPYQAEKVAIIPGYVLPVFILVLSINLSNDC